MWGPRRLARTVRAFTFRYETLTSPVNQADGFFKLSMSFIELQETNTFVAVKYFNDSYLFLKRV